MEELVSKVLTARAKQKQAIEKNTQNIEMSKDLVEKSAQPFVEALTQIQQSEAIEQEIPPEPEQVQQAIENDIRNEIPFELSMERHRWIQDLYRNYRDQKVNRTTQLEADLQGNIGLIGKVNMPLLFNHNELEVMVYFDNRTDKINIAEDDLTEGLVALILLPLTDLEKSIIRPTAEDWKMYRRIMEMVQYRRTNSRKLQKLLKFTLVEGKGMDLNLKMDFSNQCIKDKQQKLYLMLGSIKAGNTNQAMKQEVQRILDEFLMKKLITDKMHRMFFDKYNLI